MVDLSDNLKRIRARMAEAALRSGRSPDSVVLVAVTKQVSVDRIRQAIDAGIRIFGENKIQEAEPKIAQIPAGGEVEWHFIGHLQTNKAMKAVALCQMIQSVDSRKLAERLHLHAQRMGKVIPVLVQVHLGDEATKFGAAPEEVPCLVRAICSLTHLRCAGLMTLPPHRDDPEAMRPFFARLRHLRDKLQSLRLPGTPVQELSMGMSHDFEVAIQEGATMVRIGTALFGPRS
ncbi:MAG: YggS family pyridoxal phosphate-dependent enzyme [Acidobacteria bacterium]|nr:YggS family pyridoxal phosphate-dependent enzyme [Acidobacteriota bacterium]